MKEIIGRVVSTKMNKTILVEVGRQKLHPLYKKIIHRTRKFKVHCEDQNVKVGDFINMKTCRPISKEKHYQFVSLVK